MSDARIRVPGKQYLSLFRHLEATLYRAGRLAQNRPMKRSATAPDGSPASVKKREVDTCRPCPGRQLLLRSVQPPVGGDIAGILVAVRIAQHDLLLSIPCVDLQTKYRVVIQGLHHCG